MKKAFHHAGKRAHLKCVLIKTFQLLSFLQYLHVAELWPSCCRRNMVFAGLSVTLTLLLALQTELPPPCCVSPCPPLNGERRGSKLGKSTSQPYYSYNITPLQEIKVPEVAFRKSFEEWARGLLLKYIITATTTENVEKLSKPHWNNTSPMRSNPGEKSISAWYCKILGTCNSV